MEEANYSAQLIYIETFPEKEIYLKDIQEFGLIDTVLIGDGKFFFVTNSGLYATLDINESTFNSTHNFDYKISDDLVTITFR